MTCDTVWRGFTAPQTRAETLGTLKMASDSDMRSRSTRSDGSESFHHNLPVRLRMRHCFSNLI